MSLFIIWYIIEINSDCNTPVINQNQWRQIVTKQNQSLLYFILFRIILRNQEIMSFTNYNLTNDRNTHQQNPSNLFLNSNTHFSNLTSKNKQVEAEALKKICNLIVTLHEGYLTKCQNIEIFRDLTLQEQDLLANVDKNTTLHTALAGILAIDSCVKCIEKEDQFILSNVLKGLTVLIGNYKAMQRQMIKINNAYGESFIKFFDSLKYLIYQIHALPLAKSKQNELSKQIKLLENQLIEKELEEWQKSQYHHILSQISSQNEILKLGIRQKEAYITSLEVKLAKSIKVDKNQQRTSHSIAIKMPTQKSSENQSGSQATVHQYFEQITRLKEELLEKNNIVIKMNEEFASEMQKYNIVFKRLEEQNKMLKKTNDIDTVYLLEQLEYELEILRQQKRKDQLIIADIQRKMQDISFSRNSRIARRPYDQPYDASYEKIYMQNVNDNQEFDRMESSRARYGKYYSPNYPADHSRNRISPYQERERQYFQGHDLNRYVKQTVRADDEGRRKSKNRYQRTHKGREQIGKSNLNLYERVISKRI